MKMRIQYVQALLIFIGVLSLCRLIDAANLGEQCSNDFQKLAGCLSYATGQGATPPKECCTAVSGIRDTDPVCLCYIIQQAHNGSQPMVKNLDMNKLLQLPAACKLVNASVSDCPKLLHISPSSPESAIFNISANATATAAPTTTTTSAPLNEGSSGFKHGPNQFGGPVAIVAMAIFYYALIAVSTSPFCI